MRDGDYLDGEKHGLWTAYFANGNKQSEGRYDRGKKVGLWNQYWPNGSKKSEATFVNGHYTGLYTCWYANGQMQWQGRYNDITGTSADGKKEGVWHVWDENGTPVRRITYRRGSRTKPDETPPFASDISPEARD